MRRDNINLLCNLERIQRKGGLTETKPRMLVKHTAAAYVNRNKNVRPASSLRMKGFACAMKGFNGTFNSRPFTANPRVRYLLPSYSFVLTSERRFACHCTYSRRANAYDVMRVFARLCLHTHVVCPNAPHYL